MERLGLVEEEGRTRRDEGAGRLRCERRERPRADDDVRIREDEDLPARDFDPGVETAREAEIAAGVDDAIGGRGEGARFLRIARVHDGDRLEREVRLRRVGAQAFERARGEAPGAIADDDGRDHRRPRLVDSPSACAFNSGPPRPPTGRLSSTCFAPPSKPRPMRRTGPGNTTRTRTPASRRWPWIGDRIVGFYGGFGTRYRGAEGNLPGVSAVDVMTHPDARALSHRALFHGARRSLLPLQSRGGRPLLLRLSAREASRARRAAARLPLGRTRGGVDASALCAPSSRAPAPPAPARVDGRCPLPRARGSRRGAPRASRLADGPLARRR